MMELKTPDVMPLRVAMSAHSLIYAPLYLAAARINARRLHFRVEFSFGDGERGFGDEEAYNSVCSPNGADVCICDPMVVINSVKHLERHDDHPGPAAVIVGLIVQRPALWLVCLDGSSLASELHAGDTTVTDSVAYRVSRNIPTNLGRVFRYKEGSSAYYYFKAMVDSGLFSRLSQRDIAMGEEKPYLMTPPTLVTSSDGQMPDVVMTCELLEVYKYKDALMSRESGKRNPLIFAWHRQADLIPFTAVVVNRALLERDAERKNAIIDLLTEIQRALKTISDTQYSKDYVRAFCGIKATGLDISEADRWEDTLGRVQTRGYAIFPQSIRTDRVAWASWKRACDIWGISRGLDEKRLNRIVEHSLEKGLSRIACPITFLDHAREFIHHTTSGTLPSDTHGATLISVGLVFVISVILYFSRTSGVIPGWADPSQVGGLESLMVAVVYGSIVAWRARRRRIRLRTW